MVSQEKFSPLADKEKPIELNVKVRYSELVFASGLADGVWYRHPKERIHEFVLVLGTNLDKEVFRKMSKTESDLKKEFGLAKFDFQLRFPGLSPKEQTDLQDRGYEWIPRPLA